MKNNRRGVGTVLLLAYIAGAAVVGFFIAKPASRPGGLFGKSPVAEVAKAQGAVAEGKAKVDEQREKQLAVGHESVVATGAAIDAAQATAATGKVPTRELATAKTLNATSVQALDQALGPVAPVRIRELEAMVANLNAGVAGGKLALDALNRTLDSTVADKAAAMALNVELQKRLDTKIAAEGQWALERDATARVWETRMWWAKGIVGLIVAGWLASLILPLAARIFPAVDPAARAFGALWAPGVQAAASKARDLTHDFVAAEAALKAKLDSSLTPEKAAEIKAHIDGWWGDANPDVERIRAKLRL